MIYNIVYLICNLFRVYLIRQFICQFFKDEKPVKWLDITAYGLYYLVSSGLHLVVGLSWVNMLCNLTGSFLLVTLYTKNWKRIAFILTILIGAGVGCEVFAVSCIILVCSDVKTIELISFVVMDMLLFICVLLLRKIIDARSNEFPSVLLMLIPLCSVVTICFIIFMNRYPGLELVAVSISLLFVNFLVLYLYNMLFSSMKQQYENRILTQKVQSYAHQMEVVLQAEEKVRYIRHDLQHHLTEIKLLAAANEDTEVEKYISVMEGNLYDTKNVVCSDDKEIDSLVNYMIAQAKKKLIHVTAEIDIPKKLEQSFDVNVILGNLLENAIEAAQNSKEKQLNVHVVMKKGILRIRIENSFEGIIKKNGKGLITTKKDKQNHGLGLRSVQQIVDKYNGMIEFSIEKMFCVVIKLYI